jgi:hypothetical protein
MLSSNGQPKLSGIANELRWKPVELRDHSPTDSKLYREVQDEFLDAWEPRQTPDLASVLGEKAYGAPGAQGRPAPHVARLAGDRPRLGVKCAQQSRPRQNVDRTP